MAGDGGRGGGLCGKGAGSWVVEGDGRVGYLREAGAGRAATGSAARPAPFCGLCPQAMKEEGMLFSVMNILFPLMKIFCVRLISLLFYYFQFHFLHKCSRMGHKYKDCL